MTIDLDHYPFQDDPRRSNFFWLRRALRMYFVRPTELREMMLVFSRIAFYCRKDD